MAVTALALYMALAFGGRTLVRLGRTGSTGGRRYRGQLMVLGVRGERRSSALLRRLPDLYLKAEQVLRGVLEEGSVDTDVSLVAVRPDE